MPKPVAPAGAELFHYKVARNVCHPLSDMKKNAILEVVVEAERKKTGIAQTRKRQAVGKRTVCGRLGRYPPPLKFEWGAAAVIPDDASSSKGCQGICDIFASLERVPRQRSFVYVAQSGDCLYGECVKIFGQYCNTPDVPVGLGRSIVTLRSNLGSIILVNINPSLNLTTCRIQNPDTLRAGRVGAAHGGAAGRGGAG